MAVKLTDKQRRDLIALLEDPGLDEPTVADIADLVWEWCSNAWNDRAKFAVVGQQMRDMNGRRVERGKGEKVMLGFYSTHGQAQDAAGSLIYTPASCEEYATWVLPVMHKTAQAYFSERARKFKAAYADSERRERMMAGCRAHVLADIAAHPDDERYAQWRWQQFHDMFGEASQ